MLSVAKVFYFESILSKHKHNGLKHYNHKFRLDKTLTLQNNLHANFEKKQIKIITGNNF